MSLKEALMKTHRYPVTLLVMDALNEYDIHQVRKKLLELFDTGEKSESRRIRLCKRIDDLLERGIIHQDFCQQLSDALLISELNWYTALYATREEKRCEIIVARFAELGPHLVAQVPRPANNLVLAGMLYDRLRFIPLPADLPRQRKNAQCAVIKQTIEDCQKRWGGNIEMHGAITGYVYVPAPHVHWQFDIHGRCLGRYQAPWHDYIFGGRLV